MEIREAEPKDFVELSLITKNEGWNYTEDDFHWFRLVGVKTLVAINKGKIAGMGTISDYGNAGWISNLMVRPGERGQGIGGKLLSECIERLRDKATVALFSYERSTKFYESFGFKPDLEAYLVSMKDSCKALMYADAIVKAELSESMLRLDQECFGYERKRVIEGLAKRGEVLKISGCNGFAIVRKDPVEPSVGPVISDRRRAGQWLLLASLELAGNNAKAVVLEEGIARLHYEERIRRLYLGAPLKIDRSMAVAFAGLELG